MFFKRIFFWLALFVSCSASIATGLIAIQLFYGQVAFLPLIGNNIPRHSPQFWALGCVICFLTSYSAVLQIFAYKDNR